MAEPRLVPIGRIVGVFGIKGWVKIYSDTDPPDNILDYSPWFIRHADQWQAIAVAEGQTHGKGILVRLEGCQTRDAASRWVGADIAVAREQLPDLPKGEYYWCDLEGLKVSNASDQPLGVVSHMFATGANDVVVVKTPAGKEVWIPYVPETYILDINLADGTMKVDWEGEADANAL